jgi:hypothetical protein
MSASSPELQSAHGCTTQTGKSTKQQKRATGSAGGSSFQALYRRGAFNSDDQRETEGSWTSGVSGAFASAMAGRPVDGNCSTVARWPSHRRVSSTTCPSGNSSAS